MSNNIRYLYPFTVILSERSLEFASGSNPQSRIFLEEQMSFCVHLNNQQNNKHPFYILQETLITKVLVD